MIICRKFRTEFNKSNHFGLNDMANNQLYSFSFTNEKISNLQRMEKLYEQAESDRTSPLFYSDKSPFALSNSPSTPISTTSSDQNDDMLTSTHLLQFGKQIAAGMVS